VVAILTQHQKHNAIATLRIDAKEVAAANQEIGRFFTIKIQDPKKEHNVM
jgi:hypothetical protein